MDSKCPICGAELHHTVSCPMVGGPVCQRCHLQCWMLSRETSLTRCRYHDIVKEKGGMVYGKEQEERQQSSGQK